jgi:hypothetical protein
MEHGMKKIFFLIVFVLSAGSLVYGGQKSKIELTDGSILEGEIVSFSKDHYTVKSSILGTLKIEDSKVRTIHRVDASGMSSKNDMASLDTAAVPSEALKLPPAIAGSLEIMKAIPGLLASPDFQELLKDPEILNAAKSMDFKALMANEKFVKAINSSAIQEIRQKMKEQKNGVA